MLSMIELEPCAVLVVYRNRALGEFLFANRQQAETWLALIPLLQVAGQHLDIMRASIRRCGLGVN